MIEGADMTDNKKNLRIVYASLSVLIIMLLLTAASPPLYKLYCSATGYGGSVRVYKKPSKITGTKHIIVHLDTSVDSEWLFSVASHVIEEKRNQMDGEKAEMIIFVKKNIPLVRAVQFIII